MIAEAKRLHPDLDFRVGDIEDGSFVASLPGPFDVILIVDTIGSLEDCQAVLESLHDQCTRATRLVVVYYSHLWHPLLKLAELDRLARPPAAAERHVARRHQGAGGAGRFRSDQVGEPADCRRCACSGSAACSIASSRRCRSSATSASATIRSSARGQRADDTITSATVVIPARNERGNIEPAVQRMPDFCDDLEIIFVEGHSQDGTLDEIRRVAAAYPDRDIKVMQQPGKGKADAVFTAFDAARGDVLMILDADLTVPPEQLPKFWQAIAAGKGEFINGSRLVYPMEDEAMRFLNLIANKSFALLFSWLLSQRITDTLCGTKVLRRSDYERLKQGRSYFGDFDPFGDFDLIFGAAKLNLRCVEVPIRYASRSYGETQISRFRHGLMLLEDGRLRLPQDQGAMRGGRRGLAAGRTS